MSDFSVVVVCITVMSVADAYFGHPNMLSFFWGKEDGESEVQEHDKCKLCGR